MPNKPHIISNELDQAPKTGKNYFERLQEPELKKQIIDAFKYEFIVGENPNEDVNYKIKNRLEEHQKELPLEYIIQQLENHEKISLLYYKENTKGAGRHETIGALLPVEIQLNKLGVSLHREGETLSKGDLGTYLTFQRNDYGQIVMGAEQIEISQGPFTMEGVASHKKMELSEFFEYMEKEEAKKHKQAAEGKN